jgi:tetratricopeptide (TPR) repeat protein
LRLLQEQPGAHFASVDSGLRGHKSHHNLGVLCLQQGRVAEAQAHWQAAIKARPDFVPSWMGLGECCLRYQAWDELGSIALRLEGLPGGALEAVLLRGRALLVRRQFAAAGSLLQAACAQFSQALPLRVLLSHVLLQENRDLAAAEAALRGVLDLDPANAEAQHNLGLLLQARAMPTPAGMANSVEVLAQLYQEACAQPSAIHEHLPTLYALARECQHVTELGTGMGIATTALLYAQPPVLVCYDLVKHPAVDRLLALAGQTRMVLHEEDVLQADIEETDLLFVDTYHVYDQLRQELARHAAKVRKYIVLPHTTTFGEQGEVAGQRGLWPAIEEFLAQGGFRLQERYANNHGLTILERAGRPS